MNRIYRYYDNFGRQGSLQGLFAVDDDGEACLRALIASRKEIRFGEILGKHSEISAILEDNNLSQVIATPEEVEVVLRVLNLRDQKIVAVISGHCPIACNAQCEIDNEDPIAMLAWCNDEEED